MTFDPHTARYLSSEQPCRGCGMCETRYDGERIRHDEAECMREHGIRFYLDLPVGTRVFIAGGVIHDWVGFVIVSSSAPWDPYEVAPRPASEWLPVDPRWILGVLPSGDADSEALERWLRAD